MVDRPKQSRRRERWLAVVLSTSAALLIAEIGLRLTHPTLPSIAGLQGTEYRLEQLVDLAGETDPGLCHEVRTFLSHHSRWGATEGTSGVGFSALGALDLKQGGSVESRGIAEGQARSLWVAGDSLAYGLGVATGQSFSLTLADRMAGEVRSPVELRNLAVPGAGYCTSVQRVAGAMQTHTPDVVLLVLSADDLEERLMLNVEGELVALPDLAQSRWTRWAVQRSYLANLLWFQATALTEAASGVEGRFIGRASQSQFKHAFSGLNQMVSSAGGTLLVAIVEPPGLSMCVDPEAKKRCAGLVDDMDIMAMLLSEVGVPTVEARGIWSGSIDEVVAREHPLVQSGGLGMHPSGPGQNLITDALWPILAEAL